MSMLAAPRRKQKWTLNPRGKQWSEDSSKFGQKMLEKMGWSSGKGLGAKEQGMVEHVRVRVKNDQVGIGFSKDRDNQWTEHQDDFNSFLQNLQKETFTKKPEDVVENDKVLSGKSLEEESKYSTKRVHYKKFTRGKDVNKYSTKDLANIFGKKDLDEKPQKAEEEDDEEVYDPVGTKDTTAGVVTIKGGNMNEYFSKKFSNGEYSQSGRDQENSASESETRTGFGFSQKSKSTFYVNDNADEEKEDSCGENDKYKGFGFVKSSETKVKNKKLNNLNYVFDNPCLDLNILDNSLPVEEKSNDEILESVTPKKRKNEDLDSDKPKLKKQKKEYTYENEGLDLEFPDNSTVTKNKNEIVSKKSKKEKKSKILANQYENQGLDLEFPDNSTVKTTENIEVPSKLEVESSNGVTPKKSKKSKKLEVASSGFENAALDLNFPDRPTPKKNKKNKNPESSSGIENSGLDLEFPDKTTPKKSKKNKEMKHSFSGIENPALDLNFPDNPTPSKSKRKLDIEVVSVGIENPGLDLEFPDRPTPKKSKKNKKDSEIASYGLENPALDLNYSENEICSIRDFEVPRTSGVENNALNLSDEERRKKRVTFNDEIEYSTDSVNKKKKKLDKYEVVNEKVKKRKSAEPGTFVNEALDVVEIINVEEIDNEINERRSKKCKRKRERRISLLETIEEAPEEENSNELSAVDTQDNGDVEIIAEIQCDDVQEIVNEDTEKKKSKKKKKKNKEKLNATFEIEESKATEEKIEEIDVVEKENKKKKKKKNKLEVTADIETNGVDDPGKENVCSEEKVVDVDCKKKKKKKKSNGDVISLEEFLNEEIVLEKVTKSQNQKIEPKIVSQEAQNCELVKKPEDSNFQRTLSFKRRSTKQIMKALYLKNPTLLFNGSNINEIKGYGTDIIS